MINPIRKVLVGLAAMVIALTATACGNTGSGAYYDTMCVNPVTQIRMPDYYCSPGVYYHPSWMYYVPVGYAAPGYGLHISHYSVSHFHVSSNAVVHRGGISPTGGTAKRYNGGSVNLNKGTTRRGGTIRSRIGNVFHARSGGGFRARR